MKKRKDKFYEQLVSSMLVVFVGILLIITVQMISTPVTIFGLPISHQIITECSDGVDNDNDFFTDYPNDNDCINFFDFSEASTDICIDTDTGFFPDKRGKVYGFFTNELFEFEDQCIGNTLLEYVCIGGSYSSAEYNCFIENSGTCIDGRCV